MKLILSPQLNYPLTIIKISKHSNEEIIGGETIFSYSYGGTTTVGSLEGGYQEKATRIIAEFESPVDGILRSLQLSVGQVVERSGLTVGEIEEPCTHPVQYEGLCALCGRDMTELTYNMDKRDQDRAQIAMAHDSMAVKVSREEATRTEEESMVRLLNSRRLVLVVDLDLTVIHAAIDPTIGEWMADPENPNNAVLQDVRTFQLADDGPFGQSCTYYIKLRPGLKHFLEKMAKHFEMHIYTMGTRSYAESVSKIIDPERQLFGDRILSRSESGSLTAKNLKRLFPVDDRMVLVIDDRADVWNWIPNLIKVIPYDFFVGIGDINSSFLPKKQEQGGAPAEMEVDSIAVAEEKEAIEETIEENIEYTGTGIDQSQPHKPSISETTTLEQLVSMTNGDNEDLIRKQTVEQGEALKTQIDERPLLKLQSKIDAEDEEDAIARTSTGTSQPSQSSEPTDSESQASNAKSRHGLLIDDDAELAHLDRHLLQVHKQFYDTYDRRLLTATSSKRLAEVRSGGEKKLPARPPPSLRNGLVDLALVPDVKEVMPAIKTAVLAGVVLVFSGIVPLGVDPVTSELGRWVRSFGATVRLRVSSQVTHLVAARAETQKVNQALRLRHVRIVTIRWLLDSLPQWRRLDEGPYLLLPQNGRAGGQRERQRASPYRMVRGRDTDDGTSSVSSTDSKRSVNSFRPLVTSRTKKPTTSIFASWNPKSRSNAAATAAAAAAAVAEDTESDFGTDTEFPTGTSPLDLADDDWEAIRAEFDDLSSSSADDDDKGDGDPNLDADADADADADMDMGMDSPPGSQTSTSDPQNSRTSTTLIPSSGGRWPTTNTNSGVKKRARSASSTRRSGSSGVDTASRLAKRQATARGRESRLKEVRVLGESSAEGTPVPEGRRGNTEWEAEGQGGELVGEGDGGGDVEAEADVEAEKGGAGTVSGDAGVVEAQQESDSDSDGDGFLMEMQAEMRKNSMSIEMLGETGG